MLALLASPRNAALAASVALCAVLGLSLWVQTQRLESARERADALGQRLVNANAQIKQANDATAACVIANESSQRTFEVYRQEAKALRERGAKLDAQLAQARRQAATLLAESEAEDAAVERDPSHVPAQAHNEAIRKRGEGIWR